MRRTGAKIVAAAIAGGLVLSSTAGVAATAPAPAQPSPVSWTALSMLNSAGVMGLAGEASQTGAPDAPPAPPAPPAAYQADANPGVPFPVIAVMLGTLAMGVYVLAKNHHGTFHISRPNSPA